MPRASRSKPGGSYEESLAGTADEVRFGLLPEYEGPIREALASRPVAITLAAHGAQGSSASVFKRLAGSLATLVRDGVPADDHALWAAWDAAVPSSFM